MSYTNKQRGLINHCNYDFALPIMLDSEVSVYLCPMGTKARQRCHRDAMIKSNSSDSDWREVVRAIHACARIQGVEWEPGKVGGDAICRESRHYIGDGGKTSLNQGAPNLRLHRVYSLKSVIL